MQRHSGRIIKLPDNVDTDIIIPTQYMTLPSVEDMKQFAFSPLRDDIPPLVRKGDMIVAGNNFGCGSSREQAPEIIKALGFSCVIAKSFARIFYRNAINNGLLVIENDRIFEDAEEGNAISLDLQANYIETNGKRYVIGKIPDMLLEMLECGGLVGYYKTKNQAEAS